MHNITVEDVLSVVTVLSLISSLLARFHAKKASTVVQSLAQDLKQNAPQIAAGANEVIGVAQDLSK